MKKIFSLPLNPKLNQSQFNDFCNFVKHHKDYIYDVYATIRIPPFIQDAMGDIFEEDLDALVENALVVQKGTGVNVSATFNNISIRPTETNLATFIKHFTPLYEAGIKSITLPFTSWVLTGELQRKFPDLYIKNTILKSVNTAADVAKQAESGFHYINIDRDLMRNRDELEKIKRVKEKYNITIALLANESCLGSCPIMDEHHHFNNTREAHTPSFFMDQISRISCSKWDITDPVTPLKTANIPPWKKDWDELLEFVDVFKMHGRESIGQLSDSINIIDNYINDNEILFNDFNKYIATTKLEKGILAWRQFIKNCKFDCWDCDKCDKLYEAKNGKRTPDKRDIILENICTAYLD